MNARIVLEVRRQLQAIGHLSGKALAPEVRTLIASLPASERATLRTLAVLVVRAMRDDGGSKD